MIESNAALAAQKLEKEQELAALRAQLAETEEDMAQLEAIEQHIQNNTVSVNIPDVNVNIPDIVVPPAEVTVNVPETVVNVQPAAVNLTLDDLEINPPDVVVNVPAPQVTVPATMSIGEVSLSEDSAVALGAALAEGSRLGQARIKQKIRQAILASNVQVPGTFY